MRLPMTPISLEDVRYRAPRPIERPRKDARGPDDSPKNKKVNPPNTK